MEKIREQAVLIGQRKSLVGIVTQMVTSEPTKRPTVVILNTGIIHRVGHHRMYVALSRKLAEAGYMVLRFDFSGIGDSGSRADSLPPVDSCLADIREVLDWLEAEQHASHFILVGLCAGADHALLYGYTDPRVVGLILLDPSIPPTLRYYIRYILRRIMRLESWLSVPLGRSRIWQMMKARVMYSLVPNWQPQYLNYPKVRNYLETIYKKTICSGVRVLTVFTSAPFAAHRHNYREQLLEAFPDIPFGGQLTLEYFENCDHTFMAEFDRSKLNRVIMTWIKTEDFGVNQRGIGTPAHLS